MRDDLRQDMAAGLQQHETNFVASNVRIEGDDPVDERGQLAEQLDTDETTSDDGDGEKLALARRIGLHLGALESLDEVVS